MAGMFDILTAAIGQPNPYQQYGAAMQPPGGPPGPVQGGGASGTPPTPGAPPAGSPGPPGQQPPAQPQATQSPPDLAQMYAQMAGRQQREEMFNRGLGLLVAGLHPGRSQGIVQAMSGMSQDPGEVMGNIMKLQQFSYQQRQQQAFEQNINDIAARGGVTPEEARAYGPQFMAELVARKQAVQLGLAAQKQSQEQTSRTGAQIDAPAYQGELDTIRGAANDVFSPGNQNDLKDMARKPIPQALIDKVVQGGPASDIAQAIDAHPEWGLQALGGLNGNQIDLIRKLHDLSANPILRNGVGSAGVRSALQPLSPNNLKEGPERLAGAYTGLDTALTAATANNKASSGQLNQLTDAEERYVDPSYMAGGVNYYGPTKTMGPAENAQFAQDLQQRQKNPRKWETTPDQVRAGVVRHWRLQGYNAQ